MGSLEAFLNYAQAESIEEFHAGVEKMGVSQHTTYVDRDGNIAYWMSGWDPVRVPTYNPFFPQLPDGTTEWTGARVPVPHDVNNAQGYYGGWNNKASIGYIEPAQQPLVTSPVWRTAHRSSKITSRRRPCGPSKSCVTWRSTSPPPIRSPKTA